MAEEDRNAAPTEHVALAAPTVEDLTLEDLKTYTHQHEIVAYVPVAEAAQLPSQPMTVTLLDWRHANPSQPMATVTLPLIEPSSALTVVRGFSDLGTIDVPLGADGSAMAAAFLTARQKYIPTDEREDGIPLRELVRQLSATVTDDRRPVQLWTFSVYSEGVEDVFGNGRVPVWKWVKPTGSYGPLRGFWETDLAKALEDGAWRGGKELMLLVAGVSEERRQALVGLMTSSLKLPTV
ncbi:hypothetical protein SPI_07938 [Niveomyces insectorum RCEF 264]|uniref:Uncharacterized protein n=1 Tax=Niveomyces insectorum RCEF 264 TaxID=1081102 RepID=A0A167P5Y9_9HYPO|nr:hypothetical protein SPI_07938 [Niveomyces insectorum RCEF 264]